ncbi:NUDIX domain-containing protein [Streptomyces sp. NPDC048172]|uniref:NUDIX domain-containing protein n=1 Tax=Streptomyces sp. NPDC048172 TaxID=3365505 RepID=UPI00371C5136
MHKDTDWANPPRRRHGCLALIRNEEGQVLLVKPNYKPGWQLPGGGALADEDLLKACVREVAEETGLPISPTVVLANDYVSATPESAEGFNVVFDGGVIPSETPIQIQTEELEGHRWVGLDDLDNYARPQQAARIRQAHSAATSTGGIPYLRRGELAG